MQLLLNLAYTFINGFFSIFGTVSAPSWFVTGAPSLFKFFIIANYFIPIPSFLLVALSCIGFHIFLIWVSMFLNLF